MEIIFKEESYAILGACFEVYNELGNGFKEEVYQQSLEMEMVLRGIPFRPQPPLDLFYKGQKLRKQYIPDFICFDRIIIEIKAVSNLDDEHRAQLHNYLKATGFRLGILVNFGSHGKVEYERVVC